MVDVVVPVLAVALAVGVGSFRRVGVGQRRAVLGTDLARLRGYGVGRAVALRVVRVQVVAELVYRTVQVARRVN